MDIICQLIGHITTEQIIPRQNSGCTGFVIDCTTCNAGNITNKLCIIDFNRGRLFWHRLVWMLCTGRTVIINRPPVQCRIVYKIAALYINGISICRTMIKEIIKCTTICCRNIILKHCVLDIQCRRSIISQLERTC